MDSPRLMAYCNGGNFMAMDGSCVLGNMLSGLI